MAQVLTSLLVGATIASLFGLIAFFLRRLIKQNDRFQEDTRKSFIAIRKDIGEQKVHISTVKYSLERRLTDSGLDIKTKAKVASLLDSVAQVEKDLVKIRPTLDKTMESNGKIIWIVDKLEAQDTKLKGLYDVMVKIVQSQKH